jgi:fumarate reductase subunit D
MVLVTEHRRNHTMHHAHVDTTWSEVVTGLAVLGIITFLFLL